MLRSINVSTRIWEIGHWLPLSLVFNPIVDSSNALTRLIVTWPPSSVAHLLLNEVGLITQWFIDEKSTKAELLASLESTLLQSLDSKAIAMYNYSSKAIDQTLDAKFIVSIVASLITTNREFFRSLLLSQLNVVHLSLG